MAATQKGVWDLQDVRDKLLASEWSYQGVDPGSVYTWGRDVAPSSRHGVLGHNCQPNPAQNYLSSPVQIPGTAWTNIAFMGSTAIATKSDSTLWMWGYNNNGVLGQNHPDNSMSSPTQVGTNTDWDKLAMSLEDGAAIKTDGTLWAWGHNEHGALAQDNVVAQSSPVQIPGSTWSDVHIYSNAYGQCNMQGLKTDGSMWMWGINEFGAMAQNEGHDVNHRSSPVQIPGTCASLPLTSGWSDSRNIHAAINTDGELWVWGGNDQNGLGLNTPTYRSSPAQLPGSWSNISSGAYGAAAVKTDGTLWAWGNNSFGILGQNSEGANFSSPKQVGTDTDWTFASMGEYNLTGFKVS